MRPVSLLPILLLLFASCRPNPFFPDDGSSDELPFEQIALPGVDRLSIGGTFEVVIRTQEEYEQLLQHRFRTPLNEYCNEHYSDEREQLEHQNPDLSPEEIQDRLNEICIERTPVFQGLEGVEHPEIDFSEHSLLGQDAHGSGCRAPDYDIKLTREGDAFTYFVSVTQYGMCEMFIAKNLWILTPTIPEGAGVRFQKEYEVESPN